MLTTLFAALLLAAAPASADTVDNLFQDPPEVASAPQVTRPGAVQMEMDAAGNRWRTYQVDNYDVGINVRYFKNYGRFYRIDIYICNRGGSDAFFDFDHASVNSSKHRARLWSHDQFVRRARRRRIWTNIGAQTALVMGNIAADAAIGSAWTNNNDTWEFGNELGLGMSTAAADIAFGIGSSAIGAATVGELGQIYSRNVGYLSNVNIKPSNAIQGHAYARYDGNSDKLQINLPIGGRVYSFEWTTLGLERYREE